MATMSPIVIAHRTCPRHVPENSLEGIRLAAALGADGVEIDVRRTLGGELVLHHDRTLWRLYRVPWPVRLAPSWLVAKLRQRGELVRFEDVLAELPDGLLLAIDIKDSAAAVPVLEAVRGADRAGQALLWTKSVRAARRLSQLAPGSEVALLRDSRSRAGLRRFLGDAEACGARAISAHWAAVTPGLVRRAHRRGLKVYAMARRADQHAAKFAMGIDGVVTDWPEEALAALPPADPEVS